MSYATSIYRDAPAINEAMGRVYGHMMLAVITSMIVAGLVGSSPELITFFFTGAMQWIVILAPLAAIFGISAVLANNPSAPVAIGLLHGFAALMGLSFATIFVLYTVVSIWSAFMGAAVLFGTMSIYGYFTKRSLDSIGRYAFVALIAIIVVSLINLFLQNSALQMLISAIAVVVFLALTAYDTQQIRETLMTDSAGVAEEVSGALTLYLDFINLFLSLLQLFGDRKND